MSTPDSVDELLLWRAFKQGDRSAFGVLYERHAAVLLAYGYHLCPDKGLVEDAVHELFVDLWRLKANLSDTDSVKFYLFRALRRKIAEHVSKQPLALNAELSKQSATNNAEEQWIAEERAAENEQRLSVGLHGLPPRQQQVIELRFFQNLPTRQVADQMAMNEQSVRNLLQRALQKLRNGFMGSDK